MLYNLPVCEEYTLIRNDGGFARKIEIGWLTALDNKVKRKRRSVCKGKV